MARATAGVPPHPRPVPTDEEASTLVDNVMFGRGAEPTCTHAEGL